MITYVEKSKPQPGPERIEENRFEQVRKAALQQRKKPEATEPQRSAVQTTKDN